ncbi:hypothetical protein PILCRDRAFT_5197 [Piloderma croceum F 1598]|uniref:Uncharacterized protein n=1 Tax=Piloderma croceum (strain F 1598) TaxID=765440 RepID=A0A0C3C8Y7_PILCF|nr:hypothetical protein PILCRDRAFT_5197 [Piloderma croceum F 1598]
MVLVAGIAHLTPFELPELVSDMQSNEDWESFLKEMVERGETFNICPNFSRAFLVGVR